MRHAIARARLCTCLKCWRHVKKACLVWLKKLQGVRKNARLKQQHFLSFVFYITQRSYEKIMCIVTWLVQWSKLYYICIFFTERMTDFDRFKRNEWWNNRFSEVFTYCLNLEHFASLFFLAKDNFMFWVKSLFFSFSHCYSWKKLLFFDIKEQPSGSYLGQTQDCHKVMSLCSNCWTQLSMDFLLQNKTSKEIQECHQYWNDLYSIDGVILYKDCIVIPPLLWEDILDILHSAHQNVSPMLSRTMETVFWPGITTVVLARQNGNVTHLPNHMHHHTLFRSHTQYLVAVDRYLNWPIIERVYKGS